MSYKQLFKQQLIRNYYTLRLLHQKNSYPFTLQIPKKLETKEQLIDFSDKVNKYIVISTNEYHTYY